MDRVITDPEKNCLHKAYIGSVSYVSPELIEEYHIDPDDNLITFKDLDNDDEDYDEKYEERLEKLLEDVEGIYSKFFNEGYYEPDEDFKEYEEDGGIFIVDGEYVHDKLSDWPEYELVCEDDESIEDLRARLCTIEACYKYSLDQDDERFECYDGEVEVYEIESDDLIIELLVHWTRLEGAYNKVEVYKVFNKKTRKKIEMSEYEVFEILCDYAIEVF